MRLKTPFTLFLAGMAALAAGVAAAPPPHASASVPAISGTTVEVISFKHEIDFGRGIHVTIETGITAAVTEVSAIFTPVGQRRISSYSYPETVRGNGLTARFTIDTGVRAYYPPGTEFEVLLELTTESGDILRTAPQSILYLDPDRDWRLLSRPDVPLDIYYYGFPERVAAEVAERAAGSWRAIAAAVGADAERPGRYRAVIYPNIRDFTGVGPPTSNSATDGQFFGGFAFQEYGLFTLASPSPGSAVHELTHLLVDETVSSPLSAGVPSWLHEGLAQYFEAGSSEPYTRQLTRAARNNELLTLRNRNTIPGLRAEVGLFYRQAGSFVGELIERHGAEKMAETLRLINSGQRAPEAIENAYGEPLWSLENNWRLRLGAEALPEPTPTTGPDPTPEPIPASQDPAGGGTATGVPQATPTPAGTAIVETGTPAGGPSGSSGGFNWAGPLIGAFAASGVFMVWTSYVNWKRYRRKR